MHSISVLSTVDRRGLAAEDTDREDGGMRGAMLAGLGVDAALVVIAVLRYPAYFRQPGSVAYLIEPLVLLAVYAVVVIATARRVPRGAALVGLGLGVLEIVNISVETFTGLHGAANLATTAPLILGPFLVWAIVAGWAARSTGSVRSGLLASVWTAMVTMLIGVSYGFLLVLAAPGRLAHDLTGDPDYLRSGWPDLKAFVLANTFDNGFTHLLGGLVVGSVVGVLGGLVGVRLAAPVDAGRQR
jgi:hypothetical protein